MRVVGRLRHQNTGIALDEVVTANICHDLGAGQNLDMELLLDLMNLLCTASAFSPH